jgi:hypothetical protein
MALSGHRKSAPAAIGGHTLVRKPHAGRALSGLPEDVDGDAAARIPVPADAQEMRFDEVRYALADGNRAVLMERAVIAERCEIELERLRLDEPAVRHVVDDEVRKVGLARPGRGT